METDELPKAICGQLQTFSLRKDLLEVLLNDRIPSFAALPKMEFQWNFTAEVQYFKTNDFFPLTYSGLSPMHTQLPPLCAKDIYFHFFS